MITIALVLISSITLFISSFSGSINIQPNFCIDNDFDNVIESEGSLIVGTLGNDFIKVLGDKRVFVFSFAGNDCILGNDKSWIFCGSGQDTALGKKLFNCELDLGDKKK